MNLSSVAHLHTYPKGIQFDQLNDKKMYVFLWLFRRKSTIDSTATNVFFIGRYNDKMAYGQSKLANILHAKELSRRLKVSFFSNFLVFSLHLFIHQEHASK